MNRISSDFNAPNKDEVFEFMDKAILKSGVNLIDTVSKRNTTHFHYCYSYQLLASATFLLSTFLPSTFS